MNELNISWMETFFEISDYILRTLRDDSSVHHAALQERYAQEGRFVLHSIAQQWTNEFEHKFADEQWIDKDWWDEIEIFCHTKASEL